MSGKQRLVNYLLLIIVVFYRPLSAYLEIVFSQTFFSLRVSDHGCHVSFHQVPQHLLQTWLEKKKKRAIRDKIPLSVVSVQCPRYSQSERSTLRTTRTPCCGGERGKLHTEDGDGQIYYSPHSEASYRQTENEREGALSAIHSHTHTHTI